MSAFEQAFRTRYSLSPMTRIIENISGGNAVQIGDYTWDTEDYTFEITAYEGDRQVISKTYHSLPEIWDDLLRAPSQKEIHQVYASLGVPVPHLGGNAEDCPACDTTKMVYPFICPEEGP